MSIYNKLPIAEPDDLHTPEIGEWGRQKYLRLWIYADIFTTAMRGKYDHLVYVDLFSGAGKARIRGTGEWVLGSPLLALSLQHRFSKYILCERDPRNVEALRERVGRVAGGTPHVILDGNVNTRMHDITREIPQGRTLALCFADPFSLELDFATIRALAEGRKMDFLVLLAIAMDATRNEVYYVAESANKVDRLVGRANWRGEWEEAKGKGMKFGSFVRRAFTTAMEGIGYGDCGAYIVTREDNVPLYDLTLYSKYRPLAAKFWKESDKYSREQRSLFD